MTVRVAVNGFGRIGRQVVRRITQSRAAVDVVVWDLLGIFHTHTLSEAYPSETDLRLAFFEESLYLLMSLSVRVMAHILLWAC